MSEILLAGDDGGQLAPGLYVLLADEYFRSSPPSVETQRYLLAVSTAILTVRRGPTETLVWVTDMNSAAPIPHATVTLYTPDGTATTALTDRDGIARIPSPTPATSDCYNEYGVEYCLNYDYTFITAEGTGIYGAWDSGRAYAVQNQVGNLYTDRRVYRPGDTVYFRGVLRDKDDMTYSVPTVDAVQVSLCYNWGCDPQVSGYESIETVSAPISYWGTINGSFTIPATADPGVYRIMTDWGDYAFTESEYYSYGYANLYCNAYASKGTQFTVATFDTPEFEMSAAPLASEGIQGEPLGVRVTAQLYSGSPLRGGIVDWEINATSANFRHENYRFTDTTLDYRDSRYTFQTSANSGFPLITTGADGTAIIPTEHIRARTPLNVRMGVSVGEDAENHAAGVSFLLHSSAVYVGLRDGTNAAGEGIAIDVIAVTPQHAPVAGQEIAFTLEYRRQEQRPTELYGYYYWETIVTPVTSATLVTTPDGTARLTFPADADGVYRLRAETQDAQGSHSSTIDVRVGAEPSFAFQLPTYDDKTFSITAEEGMLLLGDTARLRIQTPGSGTLLLTVQRQEVQRAFVLPIASDDPIVFEFPIGYEDAPNIYVAGTFVQGMLTPNDRVSLVKPTHRGRYSVPCAIHDLVSLSSPHLIGLRWCMTFRPTRITILTYRLYA